MNMSGIPARYCWKQRSMTLSFVYKEITIIEKQTDIQQAQFKAARDRDQCEGQVAVREFRRGTSLK